MNQFQFLPIASGLGTFGGVTRIGNGRGHGKTLNPKPYSKPYMEVVADVDRGTNLRSSASLKTNGNRRLEANVCA